MKPVYAPKLDQVIVDITTSFCVILGLSDFLPYRYQVIVFCKTFAV